MGLLSGHELVVVDTETTGFSPTGGHTLIEVGTVVIRDGAIASDESWAKLVNPGRPIPPDATTIHGITDAMVAAAEPIGSVAAELRRRCADRMLVFHHASFDLLFLAATLRKHGLPPLGNPVVDTLGLARKLLGPGGNSLEELATRLGLAAQPRHRALEDAQATAHLFLNLVAQWEQKNAPVQPEGGKPPYSLTELAADSQDALRHAPARPA